MTRIERFVRRYVREQDFYARVAELCGRKLERLLRDNNIRAITTWRAKRPDRLQKKLEDRERLRIAEGLGEYKNEHEIYNDIPDLAGARVALYFPGDREQTRAVINSNFRAIQSPRIFPRKLEELTAGELARRQNKRFAGYAAEHFRVSLLDSDLSADEKRYTDGRCEVQVASVLMHAWAEVEHDLVVSNIESAILDQINGLVMTGEIALEQLQLATIVRVTQAEPEFRDQYDLANWLLGIANEISGTNRPRTGHADLAYRLVQLASVKPAELSEFRKDEIARNNQDSALPMAQRLIEWLLARDVQREANLQRARTELIAAESASAPASTPQDLTDYVALGQFLTSWRKLEQLLRSSEQPSARPMSIFRLIERSNFDDAEKNDLRRLVDFRNRAIHATNDAPRVEQLFAAAERIEQIIRQFELQEPNNKPTSQAQQANSAAYRALEKLGIQLVITDVLIWTSHAAVVIGIQNHTAKAVTLRIPRLAVQGITYKMSRANDISSPPLELRLIELPIHIESNTSRRIEFHFEQELDSAALVMPATEVAQIVVSIEGVGQYHFSPSLMRLEPLTS